MELGDIADLAFFSCSCRLSNSSHEVDGASSLQNGPALDYLAVLSHRSAATVNSCSRTAAVHRLATSQEHAGAEATVYSVITQSWLQLVHCCIHK